jgi:hypothetical protein
MEEKKKNKLNNEKISKILRKCQLNTEMIDMTGSDVIHAKGNDVTGSDVIFPRFFLTRVVVQNVPLLFVIRFTASDYSFGIFRSLYCLSFD